LGYNPDAPETFKHIAERLADTEHHLAIQEAVEYQREHFDSLRLQLGYAYGGTLLQEDSLPISEFRPKAVAGARLPHHTLADGRSTLDLMHFANISLLCSHDSGWVANSHRLGPHVHCLAQGREYEMQGHCPVLMGLSESGALLVRPDGHILAVAHAFSEDSLQCMQNALRSYMHPSFPPSITTTSPH